MKHNKFKQKIISSKLNLEAVLFILIFLFLSQISTLVFIEELLCACIHL